MVRRQCLGIGRAIRNSYCSLGDVSSGFAGRKVLEIAKLAQLNPTSPRIRAGMATLETIKRAPLMLAATLNRETRIRLASLGKYFPTGIKEIPRANGPAVKATRKIIPTTKAKLSIPKP